MNITVIGFHGARRSGKDTATQYAAKHGYARIAFADPVREAAYSLDPLVGPDTRLVPVVDAIGWEAAKDHPEFGGEVRRTLMYLGTEVCRTHFGEDFWVRRAEARLHELMAQGYTAFAFSDVRFLDEAEWIKQIGGSIWHVLRPGREHLAGHASEAVLPARLIDGYINNDGSLSDLHARVEHALHAAKTLT